MDLSLSITRKCSRLEVLHLSARHVSEGEERRMKTTDVLMHRVNFIYVRGAQEPDPITRYYVVLYAGWIR